MGSITTVKNLLVHDDGVGPAVYMTGDFTSAGGHPVASGARWHWGNAWTALGTVSLRNATLAPFDAGGGATLDASTEWGFRVWEHDEWSAPSPGVWEISDLVAFDDGVAGRAFYVGGAFTTVVGAPAGRIARWRCTCPEDLDRDGTVEFDDLMLLLGAYGTASGDVDGDGQTDFLDFIAVLAGWGQVCD